MIYDHLEEYLGARVGCFNVMYEEQDLLTVTFTTLSSWILLARQSGLGVPLGVGVRKWCIDLDDWSQGMSLFC